MTLVQHAPWCTDPDHAEVDCVSPANNDHPIPTWRLHGPQGPRLVIGGTVFPVQALAKFAEHLASEHHILTMQALLRR